MQHCYAGHYEIGNDFALHTPSVSYDELVDTVADRQDGIDASATALEPAQSTGFFESLNRETRCEENVLVGDVMV
ncbi:hypothetical protein ACVWZL_009111 [Bradyrhizobium sp. GM2.4]